MNIYTYTVAPVYTNQQNEIYTKKGRERGKGELKEKSNEKGRNRKVRKRDRRTDSK